MSDLSFTATNDGDANVFEYTVCWREKSDCFYNWSRKFFASKKDAAKFAKKHRYKNVLPRPYIVQTITEKRTFNEEAQAKVEYVTDKLLHSKQEIWDYLKYIKY